MTAKIFHAHLYGTRQSKYQRLADTNVDDTPWNELQPSSPFYLFVPQDTNLLAEYENAWKITEIFPLHGVGLTTARDHAVIDFDAAPLLKRAKLFRNSPESDADVCRLLKIPLKKGWNIPNARRLIRQETDLKQHIKPILYRPFDQRLIFYHDSLVWRTVKQVMRHTLTAENKIILTTRQVNGEFRHITSSKMIVDNCAVSLATRERTYAFPLYLCDVDKQANTIQHKTSAARIFQSSEGDQLRRSNLSPAVLKSLAEKLKLKQEEPHGLPKGITPEDIFHYAYAVFHSPTYRKRYAEFLKGDFPRLPLTGDIKLFRALAAKGAELAAMHLMESPKLDQLITEFPQKGDNVVDKVRYTDGDHRVWINRTQYFQGVPKECWEFHVGGYQVCHKWLKDRKGRKLGYEEIEHYQKIVVALGETIRLMREIDECIPGWPLR